MPQSDSIAEKGKIVPGSRLTVFAFLWACQALIHQEFYSGWLHKQDPLGWMVTVFGLATLLRPSSLVLFGSLLVSSICYNIAKWPFVVNHILLETLINATILGAFLQAWLGNRKQNASTWEFRERVYASFAPVVWTGLVVMYGFAFVAKLNWDFINPDVSCVVTMYGDLRRRFPFLPTSAAAKLVVIALTLIVEALIPVLLAFRRTRGFGVLIGVPFHLILGLVGHRTFSGLAYALYSLALMDSLIPMIDGAKQFFSHHVSRRSRGYLFHSCALAAVSIVGLLIAADLNGSFRARFFGIKVYQIPWVIWIGWSLAIGTVYGLAIVFYQRQSGLTSQRARVQPRFLWIAVALVALNGFSQYLGFKTETCFTMYSNLRTEGQWNNHMFMPALRLASYQEDLVEIVATNHPELQGYLKHHDLITSFELRRIVNRTQRNFYLAYTYQGQRHEMLYQEGVLRATQNLGEHPYLLGKILYFRPVSTEECVTCRH